MKQERLFGGILTPKYDLQSDIYADVKELEESVADLSTGTSKWGAADLIYKGDQAKWERYANSMMLLALRMTKVDAAGAQEWATKAITGEL
jgi:hypothetical protein